MLSDKNVITGSKAYNLLLSFPGINRGVINIITKRNKRLCNIKRNLPPTKGVFVSRLKKFGVNNLINWTKAIKTDILNRILYDAKRDDRYRGLYDLEQFQFDQKGPVSPIAEDVIISETVPGFIKSSSEDLSSIINDIDLIESIKDISNILEEKGFYNSLDYNDIDFAKLLKELPSSSVRGVPFLNKGKFVDDDIINKYGRDLPSVLEVFMNTPYLLATLGLRFQGSNEYDPAKVRGINIPCMSYTYFMNGVYKTVQDLFKRWDCFLAWLEPDIRNKGINNMVIDIRNNGWRILSLDYRKYDSHLCPGLRLAASKLVLNCFKNSDINDQVYKKLDQLYNSQYLCVPTSNAVLSLIKMDNQLLSGISNTQLDGSLINLILQRFIARKLGYKIPDNWGLALGDDTGLPIPIDIMKKYGGYKETLKYIKEKILNPYGLDSHDHKSYPNDNLLFLQNLYQPQDDIIAQYSIIRTVDSLVWSEQFREKIEGIKNNNALETIGQITIINNPVETLGSINEIKYTRYLIRKWLEIDDALLTLCHLCLTKNNSVNYLMNYLISAAGGKDAIVRAFRLKQSDNKGIFLKLDKGNFSQAFPVIPIILDVAKSLNNKSSDITSVYEEKTSPEFDTVDINSQHNLNDLSES